jgi:GTP-binding protein EngB required for normal cell division
MARVDGWITANLEEVHEHQFIGELCVICGTSNPGASCSPLDGKTVEDGSGLKRLPLSIAVDDGIVTLYRGQGRTTLPLHSIRGWHLAEDLLIVMLGELPLRLQGDRVSLEVFQNRLAEMRLAILTDEAYDKIIVAASHLMSGAVEPAVQCAKAAADAEPVHPGVQLLLYLLYTWLGEGKEAARALVEALPGGLASYAGTVLPALHAARLGPLHLRCIAERLGAVETADCTDPAALMFASLRAARRLDVGEASRLVGLAVSAGASEPRFVLLAVLFASTYLTLDLLQPLRDSVQRAARSIGTLELTPEEEMHAKAVASYVLAILEHGHSGAGSARDLMALSETTGSKFVPHTALRAMERWEEIVAPRERAGLEPSTIEQARTDPAAFRRLLEWVEAEYDGCEVAERAWALVRLGRLKEVRELIGDDPAFWSQRLANGLHPSVPQVWVAALAAAELLLNDKSRGSATSAAAQVIVGAYRTIAAFIGSPTDLYLANASALFGMYMALANHDTAGVRLYRESLLSVDGFGWVRGLSEGSLPGSLHNPEYTSTVPGPDLNRFSQWLADVRKSPALKDAQGLSESLLQVHSARTCRVLRVVIGGETSAGKSSLLNALLGARVMHVTQEEATAIPTHVSLGATWSAAAFDATGNEAGHLDIGEQPDEDAQAKLGDFVRRHTFLGSPDSKGIARVHLTAPVDTIPEGVEFIDTPGLNANQLRTELAERTIDAAHACIFVLDARNALKSGEMRKIQWAASAVGKTLFVVNKMDLVIGDDDLDCDANAPEEVLDRVRTEIEAALGVTGVNVYAVSSLSPDLLRDAGASSQAIAYSEAISGVRARLAETLSMSREALIAHAARKAARLASEAALRCATEQVAQLEVEIGRLAGQIPDDPEFFRQYVLDLSRGAWLAAQGDYLEQMRTALATALGRVWDSVGAGLDRCRNRDDLRSFLESSVKSIFEDFVREIDQARVREWERLGRLLAQDVESLFCDLYSDLPFSASFDAAKLRQAATPMPLYQSTSGLRERVDQVLDGAFMNALGAAAAGAVIGTAVLPVVGTAIGAFIGSLLGGTDPQELVRRVFEEIEARFSPIFDQVVAALDADLIEDGRGEAPMLRALVANAEQERTRFVSLVDGKLREATEKRDAAETVATSARALAMRASEWAEVFVSYRPGDLDLSAPLGDVDDPSLQALLEAAAYSPTAEVRTERNVAPTPCVPKEVVRRNNSSMVTRRTWIVAGAAILVISFGFGLWRRIDTNSPHSTSLTYQAPGSASVPPQPASATDTPFVSYEAPRVSQPTDDRYGGGDEVTPSVKPDTSNALAEDQSVVDRMKQRAERHTTAPPTPNTPIRTEGGLHATDFPAGHGSWVSDHEVTDSMMASRPDWELTILRNEPFARRGYIFHRDDLKSFFTACSWYHPCEGNQDTIYRSFTPLEKKNVNLIIEYQKRHKRM